MNFWPVEHFFPHFLAGSALKNPYISEMPAKRIRINKGVGVI